ncbi:MAG: ABC transporter permease [bacterium]
MKNLLKKASRLLALLAGIWIINFSLLHFSPGDTTSRYWSPQVNKEALQSMRAQKGLDQPYHRQLFFWTKRLLQGDLGYSWTYHRPVTEILKEAIPATFQLAGVALLINFILGSLLGVLAALLASRKTGMFLDASSLILYATPSFWLALLAIFIFSLKLQWLPSSGMQSLFLSNDDSWHRFLDRFAHIVLPASVLGLTGAVATMRYVRGQMVDILQQPYILMARAKGLSNAKVIFKHAFRNALLPVITQFGLYAPFLLGGAFVIEVIFAWPGMGRVTYAAIFARDYPVILAANFLTACMVIAGNLIADILYKFADPRMRLP